MEAFLAHWSYLGVFLILTISGFGVPIPEDVPLIWGGYMCGSGQANIYIMLPVGLISLIGADFIVYMLGRKYGEPIRKLPILRRYLCDKKMAKAQKFFDRHGGKVIFVARFMPGLRTPVYFSAGKLHVPAWKMLLFDGMACLLSAPALMLAGFFFWNHLENVWKWAKQGQIGVIGGLLVIAGIYVGIKYWRHKAKCAKEAAQNQAKPIKSDGKSLGKCA
ncbi:MAG: DedA family protein [Phycisphaeraceae bacterium]|mgnify:CR=1 FL=1|nr:DedA family protein [Phycisphaeraceae bacterium]